MIRTARLLLRPFREGDLDALHAIFSDERAMRYWDRPAWQECETTRRLLFGFMKDAPAEHLEFAIERDGALIGRAGMWKRYEIGYILHPDHWGHGYATEAVGALIPEAFRRFPGAERLTAEIDPRNVGSQRLLERLGFRLDGFKEKNFLYGDSEWCDTAYYSLDRPAAGAAP